MAEPRQSKSLKRRDEQARLLATQERVTLIALGVLAAVAILAIAGVVWGVILPPRAHVITVGDQQFNAREVQKRASFLVAGNSQVDEDPIDAGVNMIRRDEILLQAGAPQVGEITGDDITKAIRTRIGVADDVSAEDYTKSYDLFLKGNSLDKPTFERMVRAQVVYDRLAKKYEPEVGTTGLQFHLMGVSARDQGKVRQMREAVASGGDFTAKAFELGLVQEAAQADFGWVLPPTDGYRKDTVKVQDLQAGQMSEVITRDGGLQYDLYRMAEREDARAYTDDQKKTLSTRKVDEWIEQQRQTVAVTEDLSDGERRWILKQVAKEAARLAEVRAASAPAPGAGSASLPIPQKAP